MKLIDWQMIKMTNSELRAIYYSKRTANSDWFAVAGELVRRGIWKTVALY